MKSQASATSQPPPSAKPLTAAITGIGSAARLLAERVALARELAGLVLRPSRHRGDVGPGHEGLAARAGQTISPRSRPAASRAAARAASLSSPTTSTAQGVEHLRAVDRETRTGP
jgi:hypothetical protein